MDILFVTDSSNAFRATRDFLTDAFSLMHILLVNYVLLMVDILEFILICMKSSWEQGREALRIALSETGEGILNALGRQWHNGQQYKAFWTDKIQLQNEVCQHHIRYAVQAVLDFVGWEFHSLRSCSYCGCYHANSLNPWRLVVLFYHLYRVVVCTLMYKRNSLFLQRSDQKVEFFEFMYRHHRDWYPIEQEMGDNFGPIPE